MNDSYLERLVEELDRGEDKLAEAEDKLKAARAEFDVQAIKFAALRDAANGLYGPSDSPYLHPEVWPDGEPRGKYRFIRMAVGEAGVLALREADEPMTLLELVVAIRRGGGQVDARSMNAALQQKSGVRKLESDDDDEPARYEYDPEDDLPF